MKAFDPAHERRLLDRHMEARFGSWADFERVQAVGGLASSAGYAIEDAVMCLLVGYDDPAVRSLQRAFEWLTVAIRDDERSQSYAPGFTEASRYLSLSLCNWLLFGRHDADSLSHFVELKDRHLEATDGGRDWREVSFSSIGFVDAGAYSQALARLSWAKLPRPASLGQIRNEGQMCEVICRNRLGEAYSDEEVAKATDQFLRRSMSEWLTTGDAHTAARWMKVVHWRQGKAGLSPKAVVLKCYDYLKGVSPPPPADHDR